VLEKSSNIKFHASPSSQSRIVPFRRTEGLMDRHDEANSLFSFANMPNDENIG
jgi:hypothetical protein